MLTMFPWWLDVIIVIVATFAAIAVPMALTDKVKMRRQERAYQSWIKNWKMPEDVLLFSGENRTYIGFWPKEIRIQPEGGTQKIFHMVDMRKDKSFEPISYVTVTIWYREADPENNRHAELWWADYGTDLPNPGDAVRAAEDILRH